MDWPGRGPGASRGSQAWMFATPEEMLGPRVIRDDTIWEEHTAPTAIEAFSREFTTRDWDFGTKSESQHDKKNGQDKTKKAAAPPVRMHTKVKAAEKAGPQANSSVKRKTETSRPGHNDRGTEETTVQLANRALSRVQNKRKGKNMQQTRPQELPTLTEPNKADRRDAGNKASENFRRPEETSTKKKPKKKARSKKVADRAIGLDADVHVGCKESEAQKTADLLSSTVIESKVKAKDDLQSPKATGTVITPKMKNLGTNGSHMEPRETANTKASIQECVSLFELVKETVSKYRMQSPAHFALHIDVQLSDTSHRPNHDASRSQLNITFQNYSQKIDWLCKRYFKKGRPTRKIVVCSAKYPVPLQKLLAEHFSVSGAMTSEDTLRQFWNTNGKSFNWTNLPTELKEHVIQFCIVTGPPHPDYFHDITRVGQYNKINKVRSCELVDKLSRWKSLLRVSTQVRAITLRLCFNGSLIAEPNSVPLNTDDPGHLLAVIYRDAPKLYPELKRYGDFSQEIRKVDISFDFISFYRFFQVTVGGFGKGCQPYYALTYYVFEKMPYLNEIVVRLPANRKYDWVNKPHQMERPLFHDAFPCPRMIFRILYERIAEALAAYENVSVKNFLDETEEERFCGLRQNAMKSLQNTHTPDTVKLTIEELQEIGMHDGGGLQLTKEEIKQARQERDERLMLQRQKEEIEQQLGSLVEEESPVEHFYPIRCQCVVPCQEQYEFYPSW
ncbi:hypothetical protein P171DRAFT_475825 [Karstenula rhodostoma CBS 690.94]|uniref:Uncharacterized protein n=1 Tax=Karstenula rhodostoma CBS 690.94 TaxID=1392251 RepID=A0A9P4PBF8_9PLEO|nr:hypothetical protein P171DRAFT_475825 [Karstenula rhodostoma CBS 690.94]